MVHSNLPIAKSLAERGIDLCGRRWHALSGGRTNRIWRVDVDGQSLVVKLFDTCASNALFPNSAESESQLLRHLDGQNLAPQLDFTADLPEGGVVIYHYLPGSVWQDGTQAIARLLRKLHIVAPPKGLRQVANGSHEIAAQAESFLSSVDQETQRVLRAMRPRMAVLGSKSQCLLHGDVVPANIIQTRDGPRLIDWQCPAIGDPCHDLGIFLSPAMRLLYGGVTLTTLEVTRCLDAYGDATIAGRFRALSPWLHYRMAAYCYWRAANGATEYHAAAQLELAALEHGDGSEAHAPHDGEKDTISYIVAN